MVFAMTTPAPQKPDPVLIVPTIDILGKGLALRKNQPALVPHDLAEDFVRKGYATKPDDKP